VALLPELLLMKTVDARLIAVGLDGEATVLDQDSEDTAFGPQIDAQAWSTGEPPIEVAPYHEPHHHDWAHVVRVAAVIGAAVCLVLAGLGLLMNPPWHPDADPPPVVVTTPTPTPVDNQILAEQPDPPPLVMPTEVAAHISRDGDYFGRLRAKGLIGDLNDAEAARNIRYAQYVICGNLARGFTIHEIAEWDHLNHPDERWTEAQDEQWGHIAADIYCPGVS
jgi:hypothetical protein